MLTTLIYPWVALVVWGLFGIFLGVMLLRLVFNYADPNPFGRMGRFGFKVRKATEKWTYPAARFFAMYRIDTRLAPILTIVIGIVVTYFAMQIVASTFFVVDGLTAGILTGRPMVVLGMIIYGLLSIFVLFIFIRFISSWFVFTRKTFLAFVRRITDPVMVPVQKLIPPIGMFDISAMLVLLLIGFLQSIVLRVFVMS